jgi:hypothetical protein
MHIKNWISRALINADSLVLLSKPKTGNPPSRIGTLGGGSSCKLSAIPCAQRRDAAKTSYTKNHKAGTGHALRA